MKPVCAAGSAILIGLVATTAYGADILGPVPGTGTPLRMTKNAGTPGHLDMTWGDSCGPDQNDFAVYEGTIGTWYSHTQKLCSTAGALGASDLTPQVASSYYLVVAISNASEGSYGTNSVGSERPVGTPACRAVRSTDACLWKRVFVTSVGYSAVLGGLAGADSKCQTLADAPGVQLGGTWKAWLSSSSSAAASRLMGSAFSYRRLDGALIAPTWSNFMSTMHANPIDVDEHGTSIPSSEVWTGTGPAGAGSGGCADWTSTSGTFPNIGVSSRTDAGWSNAFVKFCEGVLRLYCIEQ